MPRKKEKFYPRALTISLGDPGYYQSLASVPPTTAQEKLAEKMRFLRGLMPGRLALSHTFHFLHPSNKARAAEHLADWQQWADRIGCTTTWQGETYRLVYLVYFYHSGFEENLQGGWYFAGVSSAGRCVLLAASELRVFLDEQD